MEATSSGKRKLSHVSAEAVNSDSDSDARASLAKVATKDFARQLPKQDSPIQQPISTERRQDETGQQHCSQMRVIVSGEGLSLKRLHPTVVHRALFSVIGEYEGPRPLRSGDLLVTCTSQKQVQTLLQSNCLTDKVSGASINVKTSLYPEKNFTNRAVISGVPLDITDSELLDNLKGAGVSAVKRLKRKVDTGYDACSAVLLFFCCDKVPESVNFSYLRFWTRPYNPPPLRCYRCNRYGHPQGSCRGKATCSKCGSSDHEHASCTKDKFCINCKKSHSAAYGGCRVYKTEAKLQVIKERSKVSYTEAKQILESGLNATPLPKLSNKTFSQVLRGSPHESYRQFDQTPKSRPYNTTTRLNSIQSKNRISVPAPNFCDLAHLTQSQGGDNSINTEVITPPSDPELPQLLCLLVQIVEFTMEALKSGKSNNALDIVSKACLKLGFTAPASASHPPTTISHGC